MRHLIILLMAVFLVVGCGTAENNKKNPGGSNEFKGTQMENQIESTVTEDQFILSLSSEKEQYKVGEELKIKAELTYTGEEEISLVMEDRGYL